jgi:hypothetical protein
MVSLIIVKGSSLEVLPNVTVEQASARFVEELFQYAKLDPTHSLRIGTDGHMLHAMSTEYARGLDNLSMSLDFEDEECYAPKEVVHAGELPSPEGVK